jgi:hypothetical protein
MMNGVVASAENDFGEGEEIDLIVDHHSPAVDKEKHHQEKHVMKWHQI